MLILYVLHFIERYMRQLQGKNQINLRQGQFQKKYSVVFSLKIDFLDPLQSKSPMVQATHNLNPLRTSPPKILMWLLSPKRVREINQCRLWQRWGKINILTKPEKVLIFYHYFLMQYCPFGIVVSL